MSLPRALRLISVTLGLGGMLTGASAAAQVRLIPGRVIDDSVVLKVDVTLFDSNTRYFPVGAHRLALVRDGRDTTMITTDEAGTAIALVPAGEYHLESLQPVAWRDRVYYWSLPVEVHPGISAVALTPHNTSVGERRADAPVLPEVRPAAPPIVIPRLQAQRFAFASIPWGVSVDSAKWLLYGQGFEFAGTTDEGDLRFSTTLVGRPAMVALMSTGQRRTERIVVTVYAQGERRKGEEVGEARRIYDELKSLLVAKYGAPSRAEDRSVASDAGGASEDAAIKSGQRTVASYWTYDPAYDSEALTLEITRDLNVALSYESAAWRGEATRRQARKY